jgi:type I restriction enzyme, S subunit
VKVAVHSDFAPVSAGAWATVPLGELCRIELGKTPAQASNRNWDEDRTTNNVWQSIADMPVGLHAEAIESREYVSDGAARDMRLVPTGTLLVSFKLTLGRLCYAGRDLFTNEAIAALLDLDERRITKAFLYWYLTYFNWEAAAAGDHKIKGKTLNKAKLKALPVLVPPLEEQKRIVAVLDQAFAALDRARAHAEANLADAVELLENGVDAVFSELAVAAPAVPLADAVHPHCKLSYGIVQPGDDVEGGLPVVRPVDLKERVVTLRGLKRISPERANGYARTKLVGGELLLCVRGSTGEISVASPDLAGANVTRGIVPIRFPADKVLPEFAYFQMRSRHAQDQIAAGTYGAALMQINIKDLRNLRFIVPDVDSQREAVDRVEHLYDRTERLRSVYAEKLAYVGDLRQSLLHSAFAGRLTA